MNIPKRQIEGDFESLLQTLQPTKALFDIAHAMFKDAWGQRLAQRKHITEQMQQDILTIDKQISGVVKRLIATQNDTVAAACENEVSKLEMQKRIVVEKLENQENFEDTFQTKFQNAFTFLKSSWKL